MDPALSQALLENQVASGNVNRGLTGADLTGMETADGKLPDVDFLSTPTAKPMKAMVKQKPTNYIPEGTDTSGGGEDTLSRKKGFEITGDQILGLGAISAGAGLAQNAMNLKEQEAMHLEQLNEQWREFEFTQRMNRTAKMVSDTRGLLASIKNINRQVARGDDQQFISSPTTGSLL